MTVEQAIAALVAALAESKGWMRDYADSVVRDAVDRKPEAMTGISVEQRIRDALECMEIPGAQNYSAGDLVELSNMVRGASLADADGDALRLAVNLKLTPRFHNDCVEVLWFDKNGDDHLGASEDYGSDKFAATRRAIVRAAAPNEGLSHLKPAAMKREMTDTELAALNARELALQAIERKERVAWVRGHSAGWDAALKNEADAGGSDVK